MKKVVFEFEKCDGCPFCRYDGDYGRSYDSGYDCIKTDKRIVDDGNYNNPNTKSMWKKDPFKIPSWCPLEDNNE